MLQTAVLHVQSAQREEAQVGDILAAILQQPQDATRRMLLAEQGITRLDILEYHLARHHEDADARTRPGRARRARPARRRRASRTGDRAGSAVGVLRQPHRRARARACSIR